jgi:hypothetical protein
MRHGVLIDFVDGQFSITCPMWANELVKQLPSRRWSKSKRAWRVPLLRLTVEGVRRLLAMEGVNATDTARSALDGYEARAPRPSGDGFPSWYPFKKEPFPPAKHQLRALDRMWGRHCFALHHDMGTFKTRTYIDFGCAMRMAGRIDSMLVVTKLSGRRNWLEQFVGPMNVQGEWYDYGWAPIPADVFLPVTDYPKQFMAWANTPHDFKVMVVGVESLSAGKMAQWMHQFATTHGKVLMVVDESHHIMNVEALRTEACIRTGKQAVWRGTTTGTPISKGPLDFYGQFEYLDPDIIGIGSFYAYRNRYAVVIDAKVGKPDASGKQKTFPMIVGYQNIDELTKTVAPYVDEVRKSNVLELPPKNYLPHVYLQMTKEQAALYRKVKDEGLYALRTGSEHVIKNVLELELRLHQIAQGFMPTYEETQYIGKKGDDRIRRIATWHDVIPVSRNPKIQELLDLARADRQFIIWCSYRRAIEAIVAQLEDAYPKAGIVQIHGDISEDDRATFRQRYQKGGAKFMVGNEATGGQSDTWTACETMIYYDNTNRMIDRAQSEDRAHRGGLTHVVDYIDLVMEGTVDVTRMKSVEQKMDLSEYVRRNIRDLNALLSGGA